MLSRRWFLPAGVFVAAFAAHVVWIGIFSRWTGTAACEVPAPGAARPAWTAPYLESQSYWLGYSYALSLAFAATAIRRYRAERLCAARNLAIGGVTLSGFLAVAGCFLIGCCGSPMLAVYLGLFGAAFLPVAKPVIAGLTTLSVLVASWWMDRARKKAAACACADQTRIGDVSIPS